MIEWTHPTVPIHKSTCRSQIVSQVRQNNAPNGLRWHRHSDGPLAVGMVIPFLVREDRLRKSDFINHKYVDPIVLYSSSQHSVGSFGVCCSRGWVMKPQLADGVGLVVGFRISNDVQVG